MKKLSVIACILWLGLLACQQNKPQGERAKTTISSHSLSVDSLTQLILNNPREASLYAERSKLMIANGKLTEAIRDLVMANQLDSLNPEYYTHLADFYLRMGKSETVSSILSRGNRLIPDNKDILYRMGNLYFYIQDYKQAMEYLNKALEVDPYFAEAYFSKGLLLNETGNAQKAIEYFQIALEREPDYYDANIQLGLLYAAKNDSLALDYYDNALHLVPDSYEAYYGKAMLYQQLELPEKALEIYEYMVTHLPGEFAEVHFNRAYIEMFFYANYPEALRLFDKAIAIEPSFVEAYSNKAYCYEQLGETGNARSNYLKALELRPNYDIAVKGLNRLDGKP